MFYGKKIISLTICLLTMVNFCFASVYKKELIFVNCTNADIQMDTISSPYKFSLSPEIEAKNGYSEPYSLNIPSRSVLKYQHLSIYFNAYIDGSLDFNFSGGINGHARLKQKQELFVVNGHAICPKGGIGLSSTPVEIKKIVGIVDNSADITFLNAEQIISVGNYDSLINDTIVVNLGCIQ